MVFKVASWLHYTQNSARISPEFLLTLADNLVCFNSLNNLSAIQKFPLDSTEPFNIQAKDVTLNLGERAASCDLASASEAA